MTASTMLALSYKTKCNSREKTSQNGKCGGERKRLVGEKEGGWENSRIAGRSGSRGDCQQGQEGTKARAENRR